MSFVRRAAAALAIVVLGLVAAQVAVGAHASASTASQELVANGGFETSTVGWSGWQASLSRVSGSAAEGNYAAHIAGKSNVSSFALSASPRQVSSTIAGATYVATAKVRSNRGTRSICIRIREWSGSAVAGSDESCVKAPAGVWVSVGPASYVAKGGLQLDAYIYLQNAQTHDSFDADAVSLVVDDPNAATPTTSPATTTTSTTTTTMTTSTPCSATATPGTDVASFLGTLAPGQTGCLHGGTYTGAVSIRAGGAPGSPITLMSYPGERAKIVGRVVVFDTANDLDFSHLDFDGNGGGNTLPSPTVDGDRVTFDSNDVTNDHTAICFDLGSVDGYGTAIDATISNNRIHDCGKLPAQNHDHGIYVEKTVNAHIVGNTIVNNADRGIQLYPDAQGSVIEHNTIVGNGSGIIISGDLGFASSANTIRDNVIADSVLRYDVESWWSDGNPVGTGNLVSDNCIWGGAEGTVDGGIGYTVTGTISADPQFVSPGAGDYSLSAGSPCAGLGA